ncbi:MAG: N-acetylmuramic acid 6-phosphate etherase [Planctomycetes bacterium]|nr:N-acetylmuramic acid 6-phosphate etherase [Planctomycetota bacterium]
MSREHFPTEAANPKSAELDTLDAGAAFDVMNAEDAGIALAVRAAKSEIVRAIELISERLARGGRLFYVGAGTSGRLGVLDASECPPTFQSDPAQVQGIIAGGQDALTSSIEGAEDDRALGARDLEARGVGANDVVVGIAAGGTTPYVHGAIERADKCGAATVFLACVPKEMAPDAADISIRVITGPEVLAGSTRLKAGSATKMVLNMLTTLSMARMGKVYGNLMVDVAARGNAKLWQRGIGLVARIVECDRTRAEQLLHAADGSVKIAALMGRRKIDAQAARLLLEREQGSLRRALEG